MSRHRIAFLSLLLVFVVLVAWWVMYLPYRPERLYCLVPGHATVLTEHIELGRHWGKWEQSGLPRRVAAANGLDGSVLSGPMTAEFVKRFCSRHTITGFVPGPRGGAWFLATWVGAYGQCMRWGLLRPWPREWQAVKIGRRTAWMSPAAAAQGHTRVSIVVVDGVLIGCLSADPAAIVELAARAELRRCEPAPLLHGLRASAPGGPEAWPDRASVTWYELRDVGVLPRRVALRSRVEAGGRIAGRIRIAPSPLALAGDLVSAERCAPIVRLLGPAPAGAGLLPAESWRGLLACWMDTRRTGVDAVLAAAREGVPCVLALLGADWSGRLRGFPVPALVAAVPLRDEIDARGLIARELDRFNAHAGLGLIPRRVRVGGWELVVIDDTRSGFLSRIDPRYRPAFAVAEGWLVFGSNADSLGRLLNRAGDAGGTAAWAERLGEDPHAGAFWMDTRSTAPAVINGLAVAALDLGADSPAQSTSGHTLRRAMLVVEQLRGLGELSLRAAPGTRGNEFLFRLDPPR